MIVWHRILEVIQYLSTVAGKAPFSSQALHLASLSIPLSSTVCVFKVLCQPYGDFGKHGQLLVHRDTYNFFTHQKKYVNL